MPSAGRAGTAPPGAGTPVRGQVGTTGAGAPLVGAGAGSFTTAALEPGVVRSPITAPMNTIPITPIPSDTVCGLPLLWRAECWWACFWERRVGSTGAADGAHAGRVAEEGPVAEAVSRDPWGVSERVEKYASGRSDGLSAPPTSERGEG